MIKGLRKNDDPGKDEEEEDLQRETKTIRDVVPRSLIDIFHTSLLRTEEYTSGHENGRGKCVQ